MKIINTIMFTGAAAIAAVAFASCGATDIVAKFASTSFGAITAASDGRVEWSEPDYAWSLSSPNGDRILLSSDFSRNNEAGTAADLDTPDAEFIFDAAPFVAAGLDIARLPVADGIKYEIEDDKFMIHFELGSDKFAPDAKKSLELTFAEVVKFQRIRIGYHEELDHYGIKLGNGNMFEWAKDLSTNDKDIVFVLNPEPFIAAGIDPSKIGGWLFAKVETMDDSGKTIQEDKLLKPFNLK